MVIIMNNRKKEMINKINNCINKLVFMFEENLKFMHDNYDINNNDNNLKENIKIKKNIIISLDKLTILMQTLLKIDSNLGANANQLSKKDKMIIDDFLKKHS